MARILLTFHNHLLFRFVIQEKKQLENALSAFYEGFVQGLKDAGNEVLVYSCADAMFWERDITQSCPQDIATKIQQFNPDLAILFNNSFYDITNIVECPIVVYEVDTPMYYSNKALLKDKVSRFMFCTSQFKSIEIIKNMFKAKQDKIKFMPFFSSVHKQNIPIKQNICFIGSKFLGGKTLSPMSSFLQQNPSEDEIEIYKQCLSELYQNPYIEYSTLINKYSINSQKIKKELRLFVEYLSDYKRIKVLSSIADLGLSLYGNQYWMVDLPWDPFLTLSYKNKVVYSLEDNQNIYNSSKIGININHHQAVDGFSWRVCDIMASNACLVSEYKKDLEILFPNINIPTFSNIYEARNVCIDLLKNENKRLDIVAQCNEIIDKKYRFTNILEELEIFLNMKLRSDTTTHKVEIINIINSNNIVNSTPHRKSFIYKIKFKQRYKCFLYSFLLILSQLPIIDFVLYKQIRLKFLKKLQKYWR